MAVSMRLTRTGRRNTPLYRLVVANKERSRDGKCLEVLGTYDPKRQALTIPDKARVEHWLKHGAAPSQTVSELLHAFRVA